MRVLVPIIFLVMTLLFAPREADDNAGATVTASQDVTPSATAVKLTEAVAEAESEQYGELVESPGLLNSITLFGY